MRSARRVHAHETLMILSGRFLPGLRTAIPVACAYANVQPLKFSTLNLVERLRLGRRDHAVRQARIECAVRVRSRRVVGPADPGADGDPVLPLAQPAATREGQSSARRLTYFFAAATAAFGFGPVHVQPPISHAAAPGAFFSTNVICEDSRIAAPCCLNV